jgi:hypothetical protein
MSQHVLNALQSAGYEVPPDTAALPELWPHQIPNLIMADVVWALRLDGSTESLRVLKTILPRVLVLPTLRAVRPTVTTERVNLPKIHLTVHRNPHPPDTSLHRNWSRYRENLPIDIYRRLGGSSRILDGDIKRGFVKVA